MMSRQQDTLDDFIPVDTSNHETLQELLNREERRLCILDYDARYDFVVSVEIPLPRDPYSHVCTKRIAIMGTMPR